MKTQEVRSHVIEFLKEKKTITAQEINQLSKGAIPLVQIYGAMNVLISEGAVSIDSADGKKIYKLIDESKILVSEPIPGTEKKNETKEEVAVPVKGKEKNTVKEKNKPTKGRDLTTYRFNGETYNKGRLALAIVKQFATSKTSFAQVIKQFPTDLVKPYGFVVKIEQARKLSNPRPRFFLKDTEVIKIKDATIAVSNQLDSARIKAIITIAKKELGYNIK